MPFDVLVWLRWGVIALGVLLIVRLVLPRSHSTPRQLFKEIAILGVAFAAYFAVRAVAEGQTQAFQNAAQVIEVERALGIFWEPHLQRQVLDFDFFIVLMNWIYVWGHWPFIALAGVWLFLTNRDSYHVYRNAFVISGAIGLVVFVMFPLAPPRLLDASVGFVDTVALNSVAHQVLQPPAFVNQYAAMPSLHFGWNLLVGIGLVHTATSRLMRFVGFFMPLAMFTSIVLTANHYIIDGLAGGLLALIGLALALLLHRLMSQTGGMGAPAFQTALVRIRERTPLLRG
ncbi:MAG: phosphatase PAP2 family protein [Chloroflexi bacterium]|nr:phosphatase PAP2 family protein [Chloroflexota bacterium]